MQLGSHMFAHSPIAQGVGEINAEEEEAVPLYRPWPYSLTKEFIPSFPSFTPLPQPGCRSLLKEQAVFFTSSQGQLGSVLCGAGLPWPQVLEALFLVWRKRA